MDKAEEAGVSKIKIFASAATGAGIYPQLYRARIMHADFLHFAKKIDADPRRAEEILRSETNKTGYSSTAFYRAKRRLVESKR
jgi:hypothetical protein